MGKCICKTDARLLDSKYTFQKNKEYSYRKNVFISDDMFVSICYIVKLDDIDIVFDYKSFEECFHSGLNYELEKVFKAKDIIKGEDKNDKI